MAYNKNAINWMNIEINRVGHLPFRLAKNPKGIVAKIAIPRNNDIIIPNSNLDAPISIMYSGKIG